MIKSTDVMKKELMKTTRVRLYAFCLILMMTVTGCDFSGLNQAADDFAVVVELEPINTNSTVLLTDAKTGELITNKKVTATFGGENGADVIDMYSDPISEKTVNSGVLNFGVKNSVSPSSNSPVEVRLTLKADGYETTTRTVSINNEGDSKFSLKMLDQNNKPQGIQSTTSTEGQAGSNGALESDLEVTVNSDVNPNLGVTLQIASGTVLKDKDGNNLSGQLTTNLSYYDPSEIDALDSFPGELKTENGKKISSAGIFSLQVEDENGNIATSSSSAAKISSNSMAANEGTNVTLTLPSGYVNPMTGNTIQEGDELSVFVLGTSGNFVSLTKKQVITNGSGYLAIEVPAFTSEAQAFVVGSLLTPELTCSATISLNRNGYTGGITGRVYATGISAAVNLPAGSDNNSYSIPNIPDQEFEYELYTSYGEVTGTHNFCSAGDLSLELNPPSNSIDATVDVTLQCENSSEAVRVTDIPGSSVLYRKANATSGAPWNQATNLQWDYNEDNQKLTGGSFDISGVEEGADYAFKTTYENNVYEKTTTITGTTINYSRTITDDICQ